MAFSPEAASMVRYKRVWRQWAENRSPENRTKTRTFNLPVAKVVPVVETPIVELEDVPSAPETALAVVDTLEVAVVSPATVCPPAMAELAAPVALAEAGQDAADGNFTLTVSHSWTATSNVSNEFDQCDVWWLWRLDEVEKTDFVDPMGNTYSWYNKKYPRSSRSQNRYTRHPGDTEKADWRHMALRSRVNFEIGLRRGQQSRWSWIGEDISFLRTGGTVRKEMQLESFERWGCQEMRKTKKKKKQKKEEKTWRRGRREEEEEDFSIFFIIVYFYFLKLR